MGKKVGCFPDLSAFQRSYFYNVDQAIQSLKEEWKNTGKPIDQLAAYIVNELSQEFTYSSAEEGSRKFKIVDINWVDYKRNQEQYRPRNTWDEESAKKAIACFTNDFEKERRNAAKKTKAEAFIAALREWSQVAAKKEKLSQVEEDLKIESLVVYGMKIFGLSCQKNTDDDTLNPEGVWYPWWEFKHRLWVAKEKPLKQPTEKVMASFRIGLRPPPPEEGKLTPMDPATILQFCSNAPDGDRIEFNRMPRKQMDSPTCDAVVGYELWGYARDCEVQRYHDACRLHTKQENKAPDGFPVKPECVKWLPIDSRFSWQSDDVYQKMIDAWRAYGLAWQACGAFAVNTSENDMRHIKNAVFKGQLRNCEADKALKIKKAEENANANVPLQKKPRQTLADPADPIRRSVSPAAQQCNATRLEAEEELKWAQQVENLLFLTAATSDRVSAVGGMLAEYLRCVVCSVATVVINCDCQYSELSAQSLQWRSLSDVHSFATNGVRDLIKEVQRRERAQAEARKQNPELAPSIMPVVDPAALTCKDNPETHMRTWTCGGETAMLPPFAATWCAKEEQLKINWPMLKKYHSHTYDAAQSVLHEFWNAADYDTHGGLSVDARRQRFMDATNREKNGLASVAGDDDALCDDLFCKPYTWPAFSKPNLARAPRAFRVRPFRCIFDDLDAETDALENRWRPYGRESVMVWEGDAETQDNEPARWVIYLERLSKVYGMYSVEGKYFELSTVNGKPTYIVISEQAGDMADAHQAAAGSPIHGEELDEDLDDVPDMNPDAAAASSQHGC